MLQSTRFCKEAGFNGAKFIKYAGFEKVIFQGVADFDNTEFGAKVDYRTKIDFNHGTEFWEEVTFNNARFNGLADFKETKFKSGVSFRKTQFSIEAYFNKSAFDKIAGFIQAKFMGTTDFKDCIFSSGASFMEAKFDRKVDFENTAFQDIVSFMDAEFGGESLSFKNAYFARNEDQEASCVKAKKLLDNNGRKEEADYHFYREMESRRKRKGSEYKYFDYEVLLFSNDLDASPRKLIDLRRYLKYNILEYLFVQVIFGYGVHPYRLWGFWWFMVGLFALLYWIGGGVNSSTTAQPTTAQPLTNFLDYLWFSITVAVTPGFAGYKPAPGFYQVLAGTEAILGTFMWAAFITTFAKKYMR